MAGGFFTKPLAGAQLYKMRSLALSTSEKERPKYRIGCDDNYIKEKTAAKIRVKQAAAAA